MLTIEGLYASYGGSLVLQGVDLTVPSGSIKAIMGRNGMGKTTLLKSIMGLLPPHAGTVQFQDVPIQGLPTHDIATRGIAYVPQGREIFGDFTVMENLRLGSITKPRSQRDVPQDIYAYFPVLAERQNQRAGSFSGGEQQMLAIARALVSRPQLLLLDEPSEGIQPSIVKEICTILKKINLESNLTILIVEQNVDMIMDIAAECAFMEKGAIVQNYSIDEICANEALIADHMGV